MAEASDLRKYEPHPMSGFCASLQLRQYLLYDGVLGVYESLEIEGISHITSQPLRFYRSGPFDRTSYLFDEKKIMGSPGAYLTFQQYSKGNEAYKFCSYRDYAPHSAGNITGVGRHAIPHCQDDT